MNRICMSACLALAAAGTTCMEAALTAEDFSHESAFKDPTLSPDGRRIAFTETIRGGLQVHILELQTKKKFTLDLDGWDRALENDAAYFWANNHRLVCEVPRDGTYMAIDPDGGHRVSGLPYGRLLFRFLDEKEGRILTTESDLAPATGMGGSIAYFIPNRPHVRKVSTHEGGGISMRVVDNPGSVIHWIVTATGEVRAAAEIAGTKFRTLYRDNTSSSWGPLPGLDWSDPQACPLGFSADAATLYVSRLSPAQTWAVYPYDLKEHRIGVPIFTHDKFDIVPPVTTAGANGILLQNLVFSPRERVLLGINFLTEFPRVLWLDPGMAEVQAALDQALPRKINTIASMSDDLNRLVVLSWTAQDPGSYHLFDRRTQSLEKLFARRPWIDAAAMAEVRAFRFRARDGATVHGYITVPAGSGQNAPPLVVWPHGETRGRATWGFSGFKQFLASRGYAVLEVNYRGSTGYGEAFLRAAEKNAARLSVSDCADAVRWAVGQKLADPARVGVFGWGRLSGCYALLSLAAEPGVYRCGIDVGGITDWQLSIDRSRIMPDWYAAWAEMFGDPANEAEAQLLREASPIHHAAAITAPVLIVHDHDDDRWTYGQSKDMAAALERAGCPVEFKDWRVEKFGYLRTAALMNDTLAFLQKHMPAAQ
jgi:dienelactone hydrolase